MSNKQSKKNPFFATSYDTDEIVQTPVITEAKEEAVKDAPITFEKQLWKGIKMVFVCTKCNQSRDLADDVIEHILLHYEPSRRMKELERLLKEK